MSRSFWEILYGDLLVIIALIPMVIGLGALTDIIPNPWFWIFISLSMLLIIDYFKYRREER